MIPWWSSEARVKPPSHSDTAWSHRGPLFATKHSETRVPKTCCSQSAKDVQQKDRRPIPKATRKQSRYVPAARRRCFRNTQENAPAGTRLRQLLEHESILTGSSRYTFRYLVAAGPESIGRKRRSAQWRRGLSALRARIQESWAVA